MKNDKFKRSGVAIFVGVLIIGAIYYYLRSQGIVEDSNIPTAGVEEGRGGGQAAKKTPPSELTADKTGPGVNKDQKEDKEIKVTRPGLTPNGLFKFQQGKVLANFKSEIHLKIKLPENLRYTNIDMEEGFAALYGSHPEANQRLAIIAGKTTGSPQAIANFLNEQKDAFPFLKNGGFSISGSIQKIQAPQGTGFGAVTIIPGPTKSGLQTVAAHVERSDGKGSYLFVMQANPSLFDSNDEGFEAILKSAKAEP